MPRGIPNAKRDDMGMKFTTFNVPLLPNPKLAGSNYLRSEQQTLWYRNSRAQAARNRVPQDLVAPVTESRRGSKVIVIHPGSRWLKIGKASDVVPVVIPHVIARRHKCPVPPPTFVESISRPRKGNDIVQAATSSQQNADEYAVVIPDDPVEGKIAAIKLSLRDRMRFYKLRVTANAAQIASNFNAHFQAETIADHNDPFRVNWMYKTLREDIIIGEKVFRLSDPQKLGYTVTRPIHGSNFNTRDYSSIQNVLNDLETIWTKVLSAELQVDPLSYKEYSVVLVIPDLWDRAYVQALVHLLLVGMGFKQICCQQESLAATYGAGISNACVIDMGAVKTSIACVDDGLVLADTRMTLNIGGDDITEFLYVLLDKISFPYKEIDLARSYDWALMEDLKSRICTLTESDVALNLYDFVVRRPGKPAEKYGLRAYDEVILAPMCLFEPRVIEFEQKRVGLVPPSHPDVSDEVVEYLTDRLTNAMLISTQHLMPQPRPPSPIDLPPVVLPPPPLDASTSTETEVLGETSRLVEVLPIDNVSPLSNLVGPKAEEVTSIEEAKRIASDTAVEQVVDTDADKPNEHSQEEPAKTRESSAAEREGESDTIRDEESEKRKADSQAESMDVDAEMESKPAVEVSGPPTPPQAPLVQDADAAAIGHPQASLQQQQRSTSQVAQSQTSAVSGGGPVNTPFLGNLPIDVCFEASKLPLDVAIFNSARAAGGDERIRKYLQAVLVVGGTAHIPGMAHALESRLQAIATPLVLNMEKVQIIPPPKDVDPRLLVWKGAAVLGKMDGVSDLWVTAADWEIFGMRGLKERCYFL